LTHIRPEAAAVLQNSPDLQKEFLGDESIGDSAAPMPKKEAFVVSIDIRKSTELMLKADPPEKFALFIRDLCTEIIEIITSHDGVLDKFTGDGVLSYFPRFFSGNDAGFRAVAAAALCHSSFQHNYGRSCGFFVAAPLDVGLGIGIDYGQVSLASVGGAITVVGAPVVYACRMSAADAGTTRLNYRAYERLRGHFEGCLSFERTAQTVKNESSILAFDAHLADKLPDLAEPLWRTFK
jgi:class 3 adenylate cyclase